MSNEIEKGKYVAIEIGNHRFEKGKIRELHKVKDRENTFVWYSGEWNSIEHTIITPYWYKGKYDSDKTIKLYEKFLLENDELIRQNNNIFGLIECFERNYDYSKAKELFNNKANFVFGATLEKKSLLDNVKNNEIINKSIIEYLIKNIKKYGLEHYLNRYDEKLTNERVSSIIKKSLLEIIDEITNMKLLTTSKKHKATINNLEKQEIKIKEKIEDFIKLNDLTYLHNNGIIIRDKGVRFFEDKVIQSDYLSVNEIVDYIRLSSEDIKFIDYLHDRILPEYNNNLDTVIGKCEYLINTWLE